MNKYIDTEKLLSEIDREKIGYNTDGKHTAEYNTCRKIIDIITSLQQEQPEVDLERIENDAELIANTIMIGVQSSRYHTCVYNTGTNDFNHSHLVQAAKKGIELGLKVRKVE